MILADKKNFPFKDVNDLCSSEEIYPAFAVDKTTFFYIGVKNIML